MFVCSQAKVTVVGLGATGLSLVRFLDRRGARVCVVDGSPAASGREQLSREFPHVRFSELDVTRDALPAADFVALSPGVPRASPAIATFIEGGGEVFGDIELFARDMPEGTDVFAVTGSNGKTTTTALAGALARRARPDARIAGNIGVPILDAFDETPDCSAWILELSSFQLESTQSLAVQAAAVINVTDNHLDRYPCFLSYAAAKERIFARARRQVLNRADAWSMSMRRPALPVATFGADRPDSDADYGVDGAGRDARLAHGVRPIADVSALAISGAHNVQNALAAVALTESLAISADDQRDALQTFEGMPHRYHYVGSIDGVRLIDDSKATTVVATCAALEGAAAPVWLIAGGDGKGQQFSALARAAGMHCKSVHLIGRDAAAIAAALDVAGVPHRTFPTLQDATWQALDQAVAGDQVVLSPACASWDMFRNYTHRAEVFVNAATEWAQSHGKTLTRREGAGQ